MLFTNTLCCFYKDLRIPQPVLLNALLNCLLSIWGRVSNLKQSTDLRTGATSYHYNKLGQILKAGKETFAFDPAHNLIDETTQKANTQQQTKQRTKGTLTSYFDLDPSGRVKNQRATSRTGNIIHDPVYNSELTGD